METSTLIYLVANVLTLSVAQILIKQGSSGLKDLTLSFSGILRLIGEVFKNPRLLAGTFLFGVSFIFYLLALSRTKLNFAQPFSVSVSMVLILIASWFFLGERLSFYQALGIILMIIGVFFLFKSS